jgi:hypothetical protein
MQVRMAFRATRLRPYGGGGGLFLMCEVPLCCTNRGGNACKSRTDRPPRAQRVSSRALQASEPCLVPGRVVPRPGINLKPVCRRPASCLPSWTTSTRCPLARSASTTNSAFFAWGPRTSSGVVGRPEFEGDSSLPCRARGFVARAPCRPCHNHGHSRFTHQRQGGEWSG